VYSYIHHITLEDTTTTICKRVAARNVALAGVRPPEFFIIDGMGLFIHNHFELHIEAKMEHFRGLTFTIDGSQSFEVKTRRGVVAVYDLRATHVVIALIGEPPHLG
jgi:hypothetical protein